MLSKGVTNSGSFKKGTVRTFIKTCVKCKLQFETLSGSRRKCLKCCICEQCGAQLQFSHQRFCNNSCAGKWKAANKAGTRFGLEYGRKDPTAKAKRGKASSHYWKGRARPEWRGEGNPNWKGGNHIRPEMQQVEYKTWREFVFQRDNFKCVICFDTGHGMLEAHHIYPWRSHEELRYDVNNGVTLCNLCHNVIGKDECAFIARFDAYVLNSTPIKFTSIELKRMVSLLDKRIEKM